MGRANCSPCVGGEKRGGSLLTAVRARARHDDLMLDAHAGAAERARRIQAAAGTRAGRGGGLETAPCCAVPRLVAHAPASVAGARRAAAAAAALRAFPGKVCRFCGVGGRTVLEGERGAFTLVGFEERRKSGFPTHGPASRRCGRRHRHRHP